MAVLFAHIGWYVARSGFLGVDVFFVLSGYLITMLLLREKAATGGIRLRAFYARRALRLYPALIAAVILAVALPRAGSSGDAAWFSLAYVMDFARSFDWISDRRAGGLGVTWSLAIEEHFYLLWPVLLLLVARAGRRPVAVTAVALSIASWSALVALSAAGEGNLYYRPDLRAGGLFIGCALAAVPPRRVRVPRPLTWVALIMLVVLMQLRSGGPSATSTYAFQMPATWLLTAVLVMALAGATEPRAASLLSWRPIEYVGRISYGVYLYHLILITVITSYGLPFSERMTLDVLLPLLLAGLSFELVEKPFLRLKERRFSTSGAAAAVR